MEVGIFPAYPRAIAASEVLSQIETVVPLVVSAAKILTLGMVVRRTAMDPHVIMSCVPRENRPSEYG